MKITWQITTKGITAITNGQNVFFMKSHKNGRYTIYRILEDIQDSTESKMILVNSESYSELNGKAYIYNRIIKNDFTTITNPIKL